MSETIENVIAVYRKWFELPDPGIVEVVCAVYATNQVEGHDPTWVIVVGPPGSGKTETLQSLRKLPDVRVAGELTRAALLSGTPRKDRDNSAKGGLLHAIGPKGTLVLKDFGSVLSQRGDEKAELLAALREIHDGSWTRDVGTDGGRKLHWEGKLAILAGATSAIDQHHGVMATLGERFLLYRIDVDDAGRQARSSLAHQGRETAMREELAEAVSELFAGLDLSQPPPLSDGDKDRLVAGSVLVARGRSPVVRDNYRREIELVPDSEAPARLVGTLARLLNGLRLIGVDETEAWRVTAKTALDSMPAMRRRALEYLLEQDTAADVWTRDMATQLALPTSTTRRALEDLAAHKLLDREPAQGKGKADVWHVQQWAVECYRKLTAQPSTESASAKSGGSYSSADGVPEKSQPSISPSLTDFPGTPQKHEEVNHGGGGQDETAAALAEANRGGTMIDGRREAIIRAIRRGLSIGEVRDKYGCCFGCMRLTPIPSTTVRLSPPKGREVST
jgi:hypothetical protein